MSQHNLVEIVLGTQEVSLSELEPEQRLEILNEVIRKLKPTLNDMSKMRRLDGEVYDATGIPWNQLLEEKPRISLPSGYNSATRCRHLMTYMRSPPAAAFREISSIFLFNKGSIGLMHYRAQHIVGGTRSLSLGVMIPDSVSLMGILTSSRVRELLDRLIQLSDDHLEQQQNIFQAAMNANAFVRGVGQRLNVPMYMK